jgi:hypothetical protein
MKENCEIEPVVNQIRPDRLTVQVDDFSVCLIWEKYLGNPRNQKGEEYSSN